MATSSAFSTSNQYVKYTISVAQNSQSVTGNTSNVTVSVRFYRTNTGYTTYGTGTVYCKINGTTYSASVSPSQKITNSGIVLFTKTLNIPHADNGEKTLVCSAWISMNTPLTSSEQSYSQVLTTIPRRSLLTVANGTLGEEQTLSVEVKSADFTHTLTYTCGTASGTICTKSKATSLSWIPPLELAAQNTDGTNAPVVFTLTTYDGDTEIGTHSPAITYYFIPTSVKPSVSLSVTDANGHQPTYGAYIQSKSAFNIVVTAAGSYGSTIRAYSTTADGKSYTAASFTTTAIAGSGTMTISATVTDTRGRTASASTTVSVLEYAPPQISNFAVRRCGSDGTSNSAGAYLAVDFDSVITALDNKNTAAYVVEYKKVADSAYTSQTLTEYAGNYAVSGGSYVFAADTASSYDVVLRVSDAFTSIPKTDTGGSIKKLFSWLHKGLGWAFGKVAEKENTLEVAFDTYFEGKLEAASEAYFGSKVYDRFDTEISNGVAAYTGAGDTGIDPDTTIERLVLTNRNTPTSAFYFIATYFYNTKTDAANKAQVAIPYNGYSTDSFHRYKRDGVWSEWMSDALKAYPVNSIYISYSHTSPAELFGGTWSRVIDTSTGAGVFLYGCTSAGVIGETGGEAAHTLTADEMPAHDHEIYITGSTGTTGGVNYLYASGMAVRQPTSGRNIHMTRGAGNSAAHNNIPPFIKVSIWRRIA